MEPAAIAAMGRAMRRAAMADLPELRHLLAADPGLATATDKGRTLLWWAAVCGKDGAVRLLLEIALQGNLGTPGERMRKCSVVPGRPAPWAPSSAGADACLRPRRCD